MTILYLHGLREKDSKILEYLKSLPHNILTPILDPWNPSDTLRKISTITVDCIIGFSMGGFFGSCLQTSVPKLLINPALCFPEIVCSRKNQDPKISSEYRSLVPWKESNVTAVFTTEDYKIGLRSLPIYQEIYPGSSITYIPGGHNPGSEIEEVINNFLG